MPDEPELNEITAAAQDAKRVREAAARTDEQKKIENGKSGSWPLATIGIGIGIGSAALAAALLYARSGRKDAD